MAIVRGVKFVDIWRGEGVPQGASFNGITVVTEVRNGTTYYCVTILETDDLFLGGWDSGYSVSSDMRVTPKISGGSGGDITLANVALWYNSFIAAGFDLRGSRMERLYNGTVISGGIVESAVVGVGIITVSAKIDGSAIDIPATGIENYSPIPYLFGDFENLGASLPNENKETDPIGCRMIAAKSDFFVYQYDSADCPIRAHVFLKPEDGSQPDYIYLNDNAYFRINGGNNDGYLVKNVMYSNQKQTGSGIYWYEFIIDIIDGLKMDDTNPVPVSLDYSRTGISDASSFNVVYISNNYTIPSGTVSNVKNAGLDVKSYSIDGNTITVDAKNRNIEIIKPEIISQGLYLPASWINEDCGGMEAGLVYSFDYDDKVYYTSDTSNYTVNTGNESELCDKDGSTGVDIHVQKTGTAQINNKIAYQIPCKNVNKNIKGILLDVSGNCIYRPNTGPQYSKYGATIGVYVYGVVMQNDNSAIKEKYIPVLNAKIDTRKDFDTTWQQYGEYELSFGVRNIPRSYYLDSISDINRYYADTDDRFTDDYVFGSTETYLYKRGLARLEFTDVTPVQLGVDYLIIVLEFNFKTTGGVEQPTGTSNAYIREIAFYGEVNESQDTDISFSASSPHVNKTVAGAFADLSGRMDWSRFSNHTNNIGVDTTPVRYYTSDKSTTADLIQSLMRESWSAVDISPTGNFRTVSLDGMIGSDVAAASTHVFEVPSFALASDAIDYDLENIPNNGIVQYNATGNGSYSSSITISNADKTTYSASYVSGVTDPTDAETLWNYARMMYLKTGTITDFRDDTSKLSWIYTEDAAVTYLKRLFEWHGAGSFQRDIVTATFTAVDIDSTLMPWRIGDYAQIKIPTITSGEYWSGVICGISYDPDKYSANITVRAGQAKQAAGIIIEKRTAETSNIIVEKRTAETTNVITEVRTNGEQ